MGQRERECHAQWKENFSKRSSIDPAEDLAEATGDSGHQPYCAKNGDRKCCQKPDGIRISKNPRKGKCDDTHTHMNKLSPDFRSNNLSCLQRTNDKHESSKSCDDSRHDAKRAHRGFGSGFPVGRPRARRAWALVNWLAQSAAVMESSPASTRAAHTSANAVAFPFPARPRMSRQARWLGSPVPPPTVPTIKFGSVTQA